jgi:beta-lactamase regulating signal transducer with metallopeptidase domain
MTLWMCWAVLITGLLGGAALSGEQLLRSSRRSTRGAWVAVMASSIGLQLWSLIFRGSASPTETGLVSGRTAGVSPEWLKGALAAAAPAPDLATRLDAVATTVWSVSATVLTVALLGGLLLLRARSSKWARANVAGEDVLVSPDFGPALIGFLPPRIVLPRWALTLPERELRLACQHEAEHRRAGDGWILLAGALAVSLMPWNPALWWMLSRLRAAVEMDCDDRVLRRGASRRAYGALLLDVGVLDRGRHFPALAFARPPSLLERRLIMIVNDVRPTTLPRALVTAGIALMLVTAACGTPAPTNPADAEGAVMTSGPTSPQGAVVEAGDRPVRLSAGLPDDAIVLIDGVRFEGTAEELDLDPDEIDRVDVFKGDDASQPTIEIRTKAGREAEVDGSQVLTEAAPDVYVDGERFEGDYTLIPSSAIERVDVRKLDSGAEIHIALKQGALLPG